MQYPQQNLYQKYNLKDAVLRLILRNTLIRHNLKEMKLR